MKSQIALIGLGVIGIPIAHKLSAAYGKHFCLIASGERKQRLKQKKMYINDEIFSPQIISDRSEIDNDIDLLIVCIKNYDLEVSLCDIRRVISDRTVILPLQNGITSYEFFRSEFPKNIVLQGYVQGPNTIKNGSVMSYRNAGIMHIGNPFDLEKDYASYVYNLLIYAGVNVYLENNIRKMVWKKWMLNIAGNSITALTGADYNQFKKYGDLIDLCRKSMYEFLKIADVEKIDLSKQDVEDIINYYVSYKGKKQTSMLVDVMNRRKTENEYLAGALLKIANQHKISLPITNVLYSLIKIKEEIYLDED